MEPASATDRDGDAALWTTFWKEGARDGCTAGFPSHTRAAIVQGWRSVFAGRPAATRLLDVGCGRGAVLALAASAGLDRRTGVDLADGGAVGVAGEDIRGGIDARGLPFADRAFDLVVSQFGIEYAGLKTAIGESARVTGRELALLVHAAEGSVVGHAREQAEHAAWVDRTLDGFGALATGGAALTRVLAQIEARAARAQNRALLDGFSQQAVALRSAPDARAIAAFAAQWRAHAARMRALAHAAPSAGEVATAAKSLRADGFDTSVSEARSGGALIGRWLRAQRRDSITGRRS
jgi:SAM-dependent methyltransferase